MESENPAPNPVADQLPEAESLPDGFVGDSSTTDPLPPKTPQPDQEVTDYKEEKLIDPQLNAYDECDDTKCKNSHANVGEDHIRVKCHNMEDCKYLSQWVSLTSLSFLNLLCLGLGILFPRIQVLVSGIRNCYFCVYTYIISY